MSEQTKPRGRWKKGESGNPTGRRPGQRHRTTVMCEKLLAADAAEIVAIVAAAAKRGDMTAARLVMDRLIPPAKDRPISIPLPDCGTAEGVAAAQAAVVAAVAAGELLPNEGASLAGMLEAQRRCIETADLARRIAELEGRAEP